ncbi:hypothetical protein [Comamonas sp. JC664]|uniref:hypothetical protein n=1 Tax=Comamonas sp. JC664 TaxID=2801917 RepID=UPI00174B2D8E|nr:hypothetical protein [Comamonas sp. JC664]MBL0698159.1 hypothetical protein [Comamonas sp. JC664]
MWELLIEALWGGSRGVMETYSRGSRLGAWAWALLMALGALLGGVSLLPWPRPFIDDAGLQWALALVTPFLLGALAAGFSRVSVWDWQYRFDLERFGAAFCVTLGLTLTRLVGLMLLEGVDLGG